MANDDKNRQDKQTYRKSVDIDPPESLGPPSPPQNDPSPSQGDKGSSSQPPEGDS